MKSCAEADETTRCETYTEYPRNGQSVEPGRTMATSQEKTDEEEGEDEEVPWFGLCKFDICSRFRFPYLFIGSLIQFGVYLNKIYQDSMAAQKYYLSKDYYFLLISGLALAAPSLMYIVYSVGSRLLASSLDGSRSKRTSCAEAFTGLINGLLLVPWQIKGRAEVLHFCSQRICARRKPTRPENATVNTLRRQASVLEFFEEFYAGMLQILLQLYLMLLVLGKESEHKMLIGEVIGSSLALISTVKAVGRKDDGPLTGVLSWIGWLSLFMTRCLALALASQVLHGWIALFCVVHVLAMSVWVSSMAWESHQSPQDNASTPVLSHGRRASIFFMVFCLFGLPSLVYWPIMFQLKERHRPFIFLLITGLENASLFVVWFFGGGRHKSSVSEWSSTDLAFVGLLFGGLLVGSICLALYTLLKPKYTDQVVMHDMKVLNANSYGIFYDFCDATFRLPSTDRLTTDLRRIRAAAHSPASS